MTSRHLNGYGDSLEFETGRIRELKTERLNIQQKTFTKWINSFLQKCNYEITNIFTDLSDGRMLMKLLEVISGEKLGRPNAGKLRVHKIENVNKCLAFLHKKVRLESIGAEDIVDGNQRLILGLVWTIILRFQIQEIEIEVTEDDESSEKRSARDALLLWCQRRLRNYPNIVIRDFSSSWRNGLGFCGLIHSQNSLAFEYQSLDPHDHINNLNRAFSVAEREFGIARLLDAEDVDVPKPDDKSILTYVSSYYHTFSRLSKENKGAKRIGNIIGKIKGVDDEQDRFDLETENLIKWIKSKTLDMKDRNFPNDVDGLRNVLKSLNTYFTTEKPGKCREKVDIEAKFFSISATASLMQKASFPGNGKKLQEIELLWSELEKEENRKKAATSAELVRLEKLEHTASNFRRKAALRESYVDEMIAVLSDPRYGTNVNQVSASLKKHKAISADILSREERLKSLEDMVEFLESQNFHGKEEVTLQYREIMLKWNLLNETMTSKGAMLSQYEAMSVLLAECDAAEEAIIKFQESIDKLDKKEDGMRSAMENIQKLAMLEGELNILSDSVKNIKVKVNAVTKESADLGPVLQKKVTYLEKILEGVQSHTQMKKQSLEDCLLLEKIVYDLEEVHLWIYEKIQVANIVIPNLNQAAINREKEKQKMLENEIVSWRTKLNSSRGVVENIAAPNRLPVNDLISKLETIESDWKQLMEISEKRSAEIEILLKLFGLHVEVQDSKSWLKSVKTILPSFDNVGDKSTCNSLLGRLRDLLKQVVMTKPELTGQLKRTEEFMQELKTANSDSSKQKGEVRERVVPQVKALYEFKSSEIHVIKGEVMFLIAKNNDDWWSVRKFDGTAGFVPRNYVTEVKAKSILVQVVDHEESPSERVARSLALGKTAANNLEVLKALEEVLKEKEVLLQQYAKLSEYREKCDAAVTWLTDQGEVLKKSSEKVTLVRKIEKYGDEVSALSLDCIALGKALPSERKKIKQSYLEVEETYNNLVVELERHCEEENRNMEIDSILNDFEETVSWLHEKNKEIDNAFNSDLQKQPENMLRRLELLEHEVEPLSEKVSSVCYKLRQTRGHEKKIDNLRVALQNLETNLNNHKNTMLDNLKMTRFEKDCNAYSAWAKGNINLLATEFPSMSLKEADKCLDQVRNEIEERDDTFLQLASKAQNDPLIYNNVEFRDTVEQDRADLLQAVQNSTEYLANQKLLEKNKKEHQTLKIELNQLNKILSDDATDKNENEFNIENRMVSVDRKMSGLSAPNNGGDEPDALNSPMDEIKRLWRDLKEKYEARKGRLNDKNGFDEFEIMAKEMEMFIDQKLVWAEDCHFKGKTNLMHKINQQKLIENEIRVNAGQIKYLNIVGKKLVKNENSFSDQVEDYLNRINNNWDNLLDAIARKSDFLEVSLHKTQLELELQRIADDIGEIKQSLPNTEATALSECREKIRQCNQRKEDSAANRRKLIDLKSEGSKIKEADEDWVKNFSDNITVQEKAIDGIDEEIENRLESCDDNSNLISYLLKLESELNWLKEKQHATSLLLDPSSSMNATPNQMKTSIEEINEHVPQIEDILSKQKTVLRKGTILKKVKNKCEEVQDNLDQLSDLREEMTKKKDFLENFENAMKDVLALESWIEEKKVQLSSDNFGVDLDSSEELLKKQKLVDIEIDCYVGIAKETISKVQQLSARPEAKSMEQNILPHCEKILTDLTQLRKLSQERQAILLCVYQYYECMKELVDFDQWMNDKFNVIDSLVKECDRDCNHDSVERILRRANEFEQKMNQGNTTFNLSTKLYEQLKATSAEVEIVSIEEADKFYNAAEDKWGKLQEFFSAFRDKLSQELDKSLFREEVTEFSNELDTRIENLSVPWDWMKKSEKRVEKQLKDLLQELEVKKLQKESLEGKLKEGIKKHNWNDEDIADMQDSMTALDSKWKIFLKICSTHKRDLATNLKLSEFLSGCEDLLQWINIMVATFPTYSDNPSIHDAQKSRQELENIRLEIEGKEEVFKEILQKSEELKESLDPKFVPLMHEKLRKTMDSRQLIHMTWQKKKVELDQVCDLQYFTREARVTRAIIKEAEGRLKRVADRLITVDIQDSKKEFGILENSLKNIQAKVSHVEVQGNKLISQNHLASKDIQGEISELRKLRDDLGHSFRLIGNELVVHEKSRALVSGAAERKNWIKEKVVPLKESMQKYENEPVQKQVSILRRYNAIESDVQKVEDDIEGLIKESEQLVNHSVGQAYEMPNEIKGLKDSWAELKQVSRDSAGKYQNLIVLAKIEQELSAIESWISNGSYLCKSKDTGADLEHCQELERKLASEIMELNQAKNSVTNLKQSLQKNPMSYPSLQQRVEEAMLNLDDLNAEYVGYNDRLANAKKCHQILRDIDDLNCEVLGKASVLSSIGSDKSGANLQNRQRRVEDILKSLQKNQEDANRLILPKESSEEVTTKLDSLRNLVATSIQDGKNKLNKLEKGQTLNEFIREMTFSRDLLQSHKNTLNVISSSLTADNIARGTSLVTDAEEKLQSVQLEKLKEKLEPYSGDESARFAFDELSDSHSALSESIANTRQRLEKEDTLYFLNCKATDLTLWLKQSETKLTSSDVGHSLSETRNLMLVLKSVENEYQSNMKIFKEFEDRFRTHIPSKGEQIGNGLENIFGKMEIWKKELIFAEKCHLLMNALERLKAVLDEKWQLSIEGSIIELANWESKEQKYNNLKESVDNLQPKLKDLVGQSNVLSNSVPKESSSSLAVELSGKLNDLQSDWHQLIDQLKLIEKRLEDAKKASSICDRINGLEKKLSEIENYANVETGIDMKSITTRLQRIEKYSNSMPKTLNTINALTLEIEEEKKKLMEKAFMDIVTEKQEVVVKHQSQTENLLASHADYLKNSLDFLKLNEEVGSQLMWISEKSSQLDLKNCDLGNLLQVESRLKRCKLIQQEIQVRLPSLEELIGKCKSSSSKNKDFCSKLEMLTNEFADKKEILVKDLENTLNALENSLLSEHFILDCKEAMALLGEREAFLHQSLQLQTDEHVLTSCYNRVINFVEERDKERDILEKLERRKEDILERKNIDNEKVVATFNGLKLKQKVVQDLLHQTVDELELSIKYHKLCRESDELLQNITRQSMVASVENYGKNMNEVSKLLQDFLEKQEENQVIQQNIDEFVAECNSLAEVPTIGTELNKRSSELSSLWNEVKELSEARREALYGAKSVHAFDKSVDELKDYLVEKIAIFNQLMLSQEEATLLMAEDTVSTFDVTGAEEQTNKILEESKTLANKYPDAAIHIENRASDLTKVQDDFFREYRNVKIWIQNELSFTDFEKDYREWMKWLAEKINIITLNELPKTYHEGVYLMEKHSEIYQDIDGQKSQLEAFVERIENVVSKSEKQHRSKEIEEMGKKIVERRDFMLECWTLRQELYTQHLDFLKWQTEINNIEAWLTEKEDILGNPNIGESIEDAERLLRSHTELEELLGFENDRVDKILRLTKIESKMKMLKEKEENKRKQESDRRQQEAEDAMKRKETLRATRERKRQEDRRRTQEIVLPPRSSQDSTVSVSSTVSDVIVMSGILERKHECEDGGKRASSRSWKQFFAVLHPDRLDLSLHQNDSPVKSLPTANLRVEVPDYAKKSFSFRVITAHGSEYLFNAQSKDDRTKWLQGFESTINLSSSENGSTSSLRQTKEKRSVFEKILHRKAKS